MKHILLFTSLTLLIAACSNVQEKRYLPVEAEDDIYFNMSLADFKALKGDKVEQQDYGTTFRNVFIENTSIPVIDYFVYYFDTDNNSPLYEVIVGYESEARTSTEAIKLLGEPNYKDTEWKIELPNSYDILAWKFKSKLIIVALIPETEWYEDINKE